KPRFAVHNPFIFKGNFQLGQYLGGAVDQHRAGADQFMTPGTERITSRTGDGEDATPLSQSLPGGDQRPAALGRLDHERASRQGADKLISQGKMPPKRRRSRRELRYQGAPRADAFGQRSVLGRIHTVETGSAYGNG